jgi:peptidyl-prolyl cis-trans isomerase C
MVRHRLAPFAVLFLLAALAGCGRGGKDPLLAKVGNEEIHASQFTDAYLALTPDKRPPLATLDDKRKFLDDLVNKQVMEQLALEKYPDITDAQKHRLERTRRRDLENKAKDLLISKQIKITTAMKDTLYENMKRERLLKGMLIIDPDAAQYVKKQLDEGADFGTLARDYSMQWVSHTNKGDIGWVSPGTLPYPVDVAAWKAPVGSLVGPFNLPMGSYLIKVMDERPAHPSGTREQMDKLLREKILEPLYLNRQKGVQDSLLAAADPYYPAEGKALLNLKYYWEPPPGQEDNQFAKLDADRVVPTFTAAEETVKVAVFKNAPAWTAKDFAERLTWIPPGLWPTGESEENLMDAMTILVRSFLYRKAAEDLGLDTPEFAKSIEARKREMRVTYFYYNDVQKQFAPTDAQVDSFYQANREKYRAPGSYKLAVFGSRDQSVAPDVNKDWKAGMDFEAIRAKYQKRASDLVAVGETEWLYEGADPVRDDLVAPLKEGGVSDPFVRSDIGMVCKLIARRPPRYLTLAEVKDDVSKDAKAELVDAQLSRLLDAKRKELGVTINEKALASLTPPAENAASPDSDEDAGAGS